MTGDGMTSDGMAGDGTAHHEAAPLAQPIRATRHIIRRQGALR